MTARTTGMQAGPKESPRGKASANTLFANTLFANTLSANTLSVETLQHPTSSEPYFDLQYISVSSWFSVGSRLRWVRALSPRTL